MSMRKYVGRKCIGPFFVCALLAAPAARAQFAVIDVASVTQLVAQVNALQQQLLTLRAHLAQAQAAYQAMTGGRGMQLLLSGTVRNYLPADWNQLSSLSSTAAANYGALSTSLKTTLNTSAVLSAQQLAQLPLAGVQWIQSARQTAAMQQVISRQALAATSGRFTAIQSLIDAIGTATDQKAVLDLVARIGAEQGMLANEQTKLLVLQQTLQAEQAANQLRAQERLVLDQGRFASRFQATLP